MQDTTSVRFQAIIRAARERPELHLPPAEALVWNRLGPFLYQAWDAARSGDWEGFVDVLRDVYLEGASDGALPLALLLAGAMEVDDGEGA